LSSYGGKPKFTLTSAGWRNGRWYARVSRELDALHAFGEPSDRKARAVPAPDAAFGVTGERVMQFFAEVGFAATILE
jgi:hypothetical protein